MTKDEIFNKMSLEEKCKLFVGKNFWELEPIENKNIFLSDGPHGIRKEEIVNGKTTTVEAICYPAACLSACSFDKNLLVEFGQELAKECIKDKIDVLLGPGTNIKRNPLCGRNFEYFSEDPFLAGNLAASYIDGVQSKHVGVSLKHFALNSQEDARFVNNSIVDERTLIEIYAKAFEIAVKKAKPWTVMASYNLVNGIHSTQNKHLLTDILRNDFGFDGIVMSDWGALKDTVDSLKAGLDLEMPGVSKGSEYLIYKAIKDGKLDMDVLDESTKRKIELYLRCTQEKKDEFELEHALNVAKKINDESIVLLKNEDNILPLKKEMNIALIGDFAKDPRIQGGGSSTINAINVTNLYDEFKKDNINFTYAKGYVSEVLKPNKKLIKEACEISKNKDVVVIMCGLPKIIESEGYDRTDLHMPNAQLQLIDEIKKVNKNIVLVLQNGSPIEMPFIDDVKGIIEAYLGGSMHASSIKDVLFGKVNPSGRLAETFPLTYDDVVSKDTYLSNHFYSLYKESIYVGYRYYDTFNKKVLFPFGYGLSYSDVTYSPLKVSKKKDSYICKFKVKNNSDIACKEVVQLYVGELNSTIFKAKKELKAFDKISLEPNEEKEVTLEISKDELRYFSNKENRWLLESGTYRFYLSKNVSDESNYVDIEVSSDDEKEDLRDTLDIYYKMNRNITNEEFETLLNSKLNLTHVRKPYTKESPISDLTKGLFGKMVFGLAKTILISQLKDPVEKKCYRMSIPYQPVRSLQMIAPLSKLNIEGLVDIFNHHPIKGIKKLKSKDEVLK